MKAKEKAIREFDELAKKLAKEHERTRKRGGMTESEKEQRIAAYEKKEELKSEVKKAQQDETGKKNPPLERW